MHKHFYASGFLYHSPTQKILLQQIDDTIDSFSLFSAKGSEGENPAAVFQKTIDAVLGITLTLDSINSVYDYFHQELEKNHFIFYANVSDFSLEHDFQATIKAIWFTPRQLTKLKLHKQTEHDIIIGQRVIRAAEAPKTTGPIARPML